MISRLFFLILFAIGLQAQAQGLPYPGQPGMVTGNGRACFYAGVGFQGPFFCAMAGERLIHLAPGWNDRIGSISIEGNVVVNVYEHPEWRGGSLMFTQSVPDLRAYGYYWANAISSLTVTPSLHVPYERICFFEHINYTGRSLCMGPGEQRHELFSLGMNDQISSILVEGGASAFVFLDPNMYGPVTKITGSVPDLRFMGWNDLISSIVIERHF